MLIDLAKDISLVVFLQKHNCAIIKKDCFFLITKYIYIKFCNKIFIKI